MDVCFLILCLFSLAFIGILDFMFGPYIRKKYESRGRDVKNRHTVKSLTQDNRYLIIAAIVCLVVMTFTTIHISVSAAKADDVVPETEVAETVEITESTDQTDTNESTTAPDDTIIPEDTEDIPEDTEDVPETEKEEAIETLPTEETAPEAPSEPVVEETKPVVDPDELEMLACVIYQEAGGNRSCDNCRRYVADIVLNRMEHPKFPDTMYEVLTSPRQYGNFAVTGIKWPARAQNEYEKAAVERAYRIAEEVLSGQHSELYGQGYIWQAMFTQGTEGFWCCGQYYGR